jgi:cell division protein FtsW
VKSIRPGVDPVLIGAVGLLLAVSAFMVYSASLVVAYNEFNDDTYFLIRQLIWIALGVVAMSILARLDYHRWQRFSLLGLLLGIGLLTLVLIPELGVRNYGSARWIRVGPLFQLQPSEFIKLALVLYMADWLARKGTRVGEFLYSSLPFLIILCVICGLVVVEPDFGTTVIIAATAISIFFIAGANLLHFAPLVSLMVGGFWFVMTRAGYRNQRIDAWFDPWQDSQGAGWHTIQTLIALGSGGLTGLGLGASRQKHSWLVNAHTDAIMAIVGEELGLIGTLAVLILFGVLIWRGLRIAYRAPDAYGRLLAAGLTTLIFWQAATNLAVVTNSAPYTGVTLPFVSFGGSSTVISLAAVGLLLSVSRHGPVAVLRRTAGGASAEGDDSGPRGGRPGAGTSAELLVGSVGKPETPISLASRRRGSGSRGHGHGR